MSVLRTKTRVAFFKDSKGNNLLVKNKVFYRATLTALFSRMTVTLI